MTFDAEIYLRLLGERLLDDPDQQHNGRLSPLRGAAAALVVAGAIDADHAWRVIDDYRTAINVRTGEPRFLHFGPPSGRRAGGSLTPRKTMVIDQEIQAGQSRLLLRDLAIIADGAILRYRQHRHTHGPGQAVPFYAQGGGVSWRATPPEIVDSDGNRPLVRAGDHGSDSQDHWDAELELRGAIAPQPAWLQIDGTRVGLSRRAARSEARVEPLEDQDPVERFLWRTLAVADPRSGRTIDPKPLVEALLAAGALDGGSRLVRDLRAVATRLPDHPLNQLRALGGSTRSLVEPWRSLLRRLGRHDGPEWTLVIDALAPVCDGVQVAVHWITSDLAGFDVEFEVAPHVLVPGALDEPPVAWWARDDRDNHYLGVPAGWYLSDAGAKATMRYWPNLDPRAKRLELIVCVDSHRTVISVSLQEALEADR